MKEAIKNLTVNLKSNEDILINELEYYGSQESRNTKDKKKRNCCHCNSSDALQIQEKNGLYVYHCFSCGSTGDVINLVQEKENLNFIEAIKLLNSKYGLGYDLTPDRNYKPDENILKLRKEIKELLEESDKLLNSDFEKAYMLRMKANDLKEELKDYQKNQEKKEEEKHDPILKVEKNLSEYIDEIQSILNLQGYILMTAPTGVGKTYSMIKSFKEISQKEKDRVFVILCPNRVQNEQNGKEYKINVVIGGKKAEQHIRVLSCVYEKINEIMEAYRDKKITLVVDEAHQLIESISYRESAINKIDEASKKAFNVIHMTATDRKLKEYYTYNYRFKFDFQGNNNNLETLSIIPCEDVEENLFRLLQINKNEHKKSLVFISGSKQNLLHISETLKNKSFKVGTITSTDKSTLLYRNIVEKSSITKEYDVILSTKVLECGTNIKDTNIVPIEVVESPNHFDLDSTEQKFARLRSKNKNGYILIKNQENAEEKEEFKSFYSIYRALETSLKYSIEGINALVKLSNTDYIDIKNTLIESIKLSVNAITGALGGIIEIDEDFNITINQKKLINKAFREYDKQFLRDTELLKKELKNRIKADKIEVLFDISNEETEEFKDQLNEVKKLQKEVKAANSEKAKNLIKELNKSIYLSEYLASKDKFELMLMYKQLNKNVYDAFEFLEEEEKELLKIKKLHNINILSDNFDLLIKYYDTCKTVADADRIAKHFNYLELNQILNVKDIPDIYSSYGVLRRRFDKVKNKQGRITKRDIISTVTELHCKKLLWQFDKRRVKEDFESYLKEQDKKKKDKILNRIVDKFLYELNLIYELSNDEKGIKISSLK